jgi:hypothetical protein
MSIIAIAILMHYRHTRLYLIVLSNYNASKENTGMNKLGNYVKGSDSGPVSCPRNYCKDYHQDR